MNQKFQLTPPNRFLIMLKNPPELQYFFQRLQMNLTLEDSNIKCS